MNATADLRHEHGAVIRMLGIMETMADGVRNGARFNRDELTEVIEFLSVFVDRCHHTKEEQVLFPALITAGIAGVESTIANLLADHVLGRETAARMAELTGRLAEHEDTASAGLVHAMDSYAEVLRNHIRREERDCFDIADEKLPSAVQDELVAGYERVEREVVGEGRHEAFHAMLDRLSAIYR